MSNITFKSLDHRKPLSLQFLPLLYSYQPTQLKPWVSLAAHYPLKPSVRYDKALTHVPVDNTDKPSQFDSSPRSDQLVDATHGARHYRSHAPPFCYFENSGSFYTKIKPYVSFCVSGLYYYFYAFCKFHFILFVYFLVNVERGFSVIWGYGFECFRRSYNTHRCRGT